MTTSTTTSTTTTTTFTDPEIAEESKTVSTCKVYLKNLFELDIISILVETTLVVIGTKAIVSSQIVNAEMEADIVTMEVSNFTVLPSNDTALQRRKRQAKLDDNCFWGKRGNRSLKSCINS